VSVGASVETFTNSSSCQSSGTTSDQQIGSTLTYNSGAQTYTYTARDGTVYTFAWDTVDLAGYLLTVTRPAGEVTQYSYDAATICEPSPQNCLFPYVVRRLNSISNNLGYALVFEYPGTVL